MRVHGLRAALVVFAALGALVFWSVPAWAGKGYESVTGTIGEACKSSPCPGGQFDEPTGIAVSDETGDVYVIDRGDNRVEWFSAEGEHFEGQFNGSDEYEVRVGGKLEKKTGTPAPTGEFLEPEGIAVDNDPSSVSRGDLYVADQGHHVVDKFSATGEYLGQFTGGSCENSAEMPPCAGSKLSPFNRPLDVGVDGAGDLWVYEGASEKAYGFTNTGSYLEAFHTEESVTNEAPGFAVDTNGNLYVNLGRGRIDEFTRPSGGRTIIQDGTSASATLAIIPVNGDLLIDNGSQVELFDAPLGENPAVSRTFPTTGLSDSAGIAVNGENGEGTLYATQRGEDDVDVFSPGAPGKPEILSESASSVSQDEGQFEAVINPNGLNTTYSVEYSRYVNANGELELATTVPGGSLPAGFAGPTVTVPGADFFYLDSYYYRVVAENDESKGVPTYGPVQVYTKLPVIAEKEEKVIDLTSTTALLEATIHPDFFSAAYAFEYADNKTALENGEGTVIHGATGGLQLKKHAELEQLEKNLEREEKEEQAGLLPPGTVPPGAVPICPGIEQAGGTGALQENPNIDYKCPVSAEISGLVPGRTYYYRVVAESEITQNTKNANKGKPVASKKIEEFKPYAAPTVTTGEVANITKTAATLSGTVNPEGVETTYQFAYISQTAYEKAIDGDAEEQADPYAEGETTAPVTLQPSEATQSIGPIQASGLQPAETYRYRLVATNRYGVQSAGQGGTFTTQPGTPPSATTGTATNITQNTATLSGAVSTNGLQTSYAFEIGTEPGFYGPPTGLGSIGGELTAPVSVTLGELQPGTTYYYRVTATNADGTTPGEPATFTTPGFPSLLSAPVSPPQIAIPATAFPTDVTESATPGKAKAKTKPKTRAQKLARALKQCRKQPRKSRAKCERQAHSRYGPAKKKV